jgi:hypothetical protein
MNYEIGLFLMRCRIRAGKSPEEAAQLLNVTSHELNAYESGHIGIPLSYLYRLVKFYKLEGQELLQFLHKLQDKYINNS